jgi:hypothetical protein
MIDLRHGMYEIDRIFSYTNYVLMDHDNTRGYSNLPDDLISIIL